MASTLLPVVLMAFLVSTPHMYTIRPYQTTLVHVYLLIAEDVAGGCDQGEAIPSCRPAAREVVGGRAADMWAGAPNGRQQGWWDGVANGEGDAIDFCTFFSSFMTPNDAACALLCAVSLPAQIRGQRAGKARDRGAIEAGRRGLTGR